MTIRDMLTKWGFQVDHAPLDKVEHQLEQIKHRLEFLAAAEVVKAVYELTERFAHFAEEIHLAAQSAGLTVEAFQKLSFAATQSGISQEQMGTSMARLAKHLYQARQGGEEAIKTFTAVGFTPAQIKGFRTGQDVMLALADKMKGINDPIKKQAIAMELMGRGSQNMVGFLSQGSHAIKGMGDEAEALGAILGEHQIHALVELEHAFMKVFAVIKAIAGSIAATLAPDVKYLIDTFLHWTKANKALIAVDLQRWIGDFTYALGYVWGVIEGVIKLIMDFAETHKTLWRVIETFILVAGAILLGSLALSKMFSIWNTFKSAYSAASTILTSPFALWLIAIGLIVVAIHDLWEAFHGRPTWIQAFIDWLGIGSEVEAVFDTIFQLISDLMNLRFGDFIMHELQAVIGGIGYLKDTLLSFLPKGMAEKIGFGLDVAGKVATDTIPGLGAGLDSIKNTPTLVGNQGAAPSSNQYSVNAPININVPGGVDAKDVGKHVQTGVKEHLDRVYRETQRSLTPAQAY